MSHHVGEGLEDYRQQLADLRKEIGTDQLDIGSTGEYPNGKKYQADKGELKMAVVADKERGVVHLDFGEPINLLTMTPKEAADLAQALNEKAREVD